MRKLILLILISIAVFVIIFWVIFADKNTLHNVITKKYELPIILHEVSSISYLGNDKIACIQDELGIIFIYDLKVEKIIEEINFNLPGDYEGIEYVNDNFYVLRSDGVIYEIPNSKTKLQIVEYNLDIFAKNNEGLAYDKESNRLLVSTKSKVAVGKEEKNKSYIYAFDLKKKEISPNPIIVINLDDVENYINNQNREFKEIDDKKTLKFRPAGIAIHPIKRLLYVISAVDNLVISIDFDGNILTAHQLDISVFNKPEGLDFNENGDAFISNEGGDGKPTIFKLKIESLN